MIAAISQTKGVVGHDVTASSLTPSAQDTAVMFHEQELVCGIYGEGFCEGWVSPVIKTVAVPHVLQFAVSRCLTDRADMVSF